MWFCGYCVVLYLLFWNTRFAYCCSLMMLAGCGVFVNTSVWFVGGDVVCYSRCCFLGFVFAFI